MTPQDFCPFAVPAPQFHFVGKPLFADGESTTWNLATLKDRLLTVATWYFGCSKEMESGPWYEQRSAFGAREANLSDFIQTFRAVDHSDRFRTLTLSRYGSDLSFNIINRIIADLVSSSGGTLTIASAEELTLGDVADRLTSMADSPPLSTQGDTNPSAVLEYRNRTENLPLQNPVNDLRLFCLDVRNAHVAVWFGESNNITIDRRFAFLLLLRKNHSWTNRLNELIEAARRSVVRQRVDSLIQRFEKTVPRIIHMVDERMKNLPTSPARIHLRPHNGILCSEKELGEPATARKPAESLAEDRAFDDTHIELNSLAVSLDELLKSDASAKTVSAPLPPLDETISLVDLRAYIIRCLDRLGSVDSPDETERAIMLGKSYAYAVRLDLAEEAEIPNEVLTVDRARERLQDLFLRFGVLAMQPKNGDSNATTKGEPDSQESPFTKLIDACDSELKWLTSEDRLKPHNPYEQVAELQKRLWPLVDTAVRLADAGPPVLPDQVTALTLPRGAAVTKAIVIAKQVRAWALAQRTPLGTVPGLLMRTANQPSADQTSTEGVNAPAVKGKKINERMLATLQKSPESLQWSAQQWADALECSKSTIVETRTWKTTIRAAQAREQADRGLHQKGKGGRRPNS